MAEKVRGTPRWGQPRRSSWDLGLSGGKKTLPLTGCDPKNPSFHHSCSRAVGANSLAS